ncbi:MAG TPA: hypothetical protein VJ302_08935 [Blastocatellia bacterium]|nr:hypothetical protein [Blastocatellia bacterium]
MSRKKADRTPVKRRAAESSPDSGRRRFVFLGAGALAAAGVGLFGAHRAGWFGPEAAAPTLPSAGAAWRVLPPKVEAADYPQALQAADEMLGHYGRVLGQPSPLIHAVRGLGRNFKLADGARAVDHLCSTQAADREVNGRRRVYFRREAEVHENSFLKTFLEAGVSLDQPVIAGDRRYSLREVAESARALFRCDPQNLYRYDDRTFRYDSSSAVPPASSGPGELLHEHLPWGLIAFSILVPPESASWTNDFGEQIDLAAVIDRSLAEYETTCALGREELTRDQTSPPPFREAIKKYSCFGLHSVYGYLACLKAGYGDQDLSARLERVLNLVICRLKGDADAIDREYVREARGASPQLVEAFRQRALVKLYGHAFEAINYARLHQLFAFTSEQERRIRTGEQAFYESLVKIRAMDWNLLYQALGEKFVSDLVIALGHASRALKLLTRESPDRVQS